VPLSFLKIKNKELINIITSAKLNNFRLKVRQQYSFVFTLKFYRQDFIFFKVFILLFKKEKKKKESLYLTFQKKKKKSLS
jgi:hypothetical protein